jgi:hypothetical protein
MCIKIINSGVECSYDNSKPLEDQLCDSSEIHIKYEPKDSNMDRFLDEMERLCKTGVSANVNVDFSHNSNITGMKMKKQINRLTKDLHLNEAIKILTKLQSTTDGALRELSDFCNGKNNER